MAFEDTLRSLREFDVNDLDIDNIGSWPIAVKIFIWAALLAAVLTAGYYYHIESLQVQLKSAAGEEDGLKKEFEKKAFLLVKGKASVNYDLTKMEYHVDGATKTIKLINMLAPQISVEPEIKY